MITISILVSNENNRKREFWIDNTKTFACILVVLGHFFQSMVQSEILPLNDLYQWFIRTIYYFHVPLFFICSGYLYQKLSVVNTFNSWYKNVLKKLISLGIPFVTFSFITWILKTLFSSSVNNEIGKLYEIILFKPTAPYWYLYALFFIFLVTPTFSSKFKAYIALFIALTLKLIFIVTQGFSVSIISYIFNDEIWFILGMLICIFDIPKIIENNNSNLFLGIVLSIIFIILSVLVFIKNINFGILNFLLGIIGCLSTTLIMIIMSKSQRFKNHKNIWNVLARYTMPIFLMHTIFAAPLRILLVKIGIINIFIHTVLGILISFIGPIIVAKFIRKFKYLDMLIYPTKYIKIK